jgi:hypothetical protein
MSLSGHQSARMKNDEWLTPPSIISSLGQFDLDPCAPICLVAYGSDNVVALIESGLGVVMTDQVYCPPPNVTQPEKNCPRIDGSKLSAHDQVPRDEFDQEAM